MEKMNEVGLGCTVEVGVLCRVFGVVVKSLNQTIVPGVDKLEHPL